jgi:hypothetical protein
MARHQAEFFDTPLDLVFIAGNVSDAQFVERVLTERGVDYALSLEPFKHESVLSAVFGNTYNGLFFYVPLAVHQTVVEILEGAGMTDTVRLTAEKRNEDSHAA